MQSWVPAYVKLGASLQLYVNRVTSKTNISILQNGFKNQIFFERSGFFFFILILIRGIFFFWAGLGRFSRAFLFPSFFIYGAASAPHWRAGARPRPLECHVSLGTFGCVECGRFWPSLEPPHFPLLW
jgi:hypothetical protein